MGSSATDRGPTARTRADDYERLRRAVLEAAGDTEPGLRAEVEGRTATLSGRPGPTAPLPGPLGLYVDKLAQHAYRVVDSDVAGLQASGHAQDAIFELTLAASMLLKRGYA